MRKVKKIPGKASLLLMFTIGILFQTAPDWGSECGPGRACIGPKAVFAQTPEGNDKTLSPYFFVKSDDSSVDQLPLKSTSVDVNIAGVIADVKVTQVYRNAGQKPLEAIYVFPASTRAAVYGMKMTIGERTIIAEIQKREEARAKYEQAKQEGKSASLLEQQRPNVFQMNVANILPGDEIRTELQYTELISPSEGIYEFVYPTVVGPRYSNQPEATAPPSEQWSKNPYLHQGEQPPYTFDMAIRLTTGVPIQEMTCASHQVDIRYEDPSVASVALAAKEKSGGNRDFILKYRLAGAQIDSGLLLYEGKEENFFLLMVQPPKRFEPGQVPPREYIFIVDVSGSMHGFPLDISKRLLRDLLGNLRPIDAFNVLLFSGGSQLLAERSLPATAENVKRAIEVIDNQQGGGGTELLPALKRALQLPRSEKAARTLVIATDGYVTVEPEAFDLIRKGLGSANFFSFGIGSSVNRFLIEGMARAGAGEPFIITKPHEASAVAEKFRKTIESPLLTQIRLNLGTFDAYDVGPSAVPDVFAERPVVICGKWRGRPEGSITLQGIAGSESYSRSINTASVKPLAANSALRYLWARSRIARLGDYNLLQADDSRIAEITDLALRYNLLSAYTSFVAVDTEIRRKTGEVTTVKQPLPLPEGVSERAVGILPRPVAMSRTPAGASESGLFMKQAVQAGQPYSETKAADGIKEAASNEKGDAEARAPRKIQVAGITVTRGLSEVAVRKVVEQHMEAMRKCFSERLSVLPEEIVVEWRIDAQGKVKGVKVKGSEPDTRKIEQCLTDLIKQWRFAAPAGNIEVAVSAVLRY